MIERYTLPEMKATWDDQVKYQLWLDIEYAVCEELAKMGKIPKEAWKELKQNIQKLIQEGGVSPERVKEIEETTKHDVIAFTTAVAEKVGPTSRYVHFGLTSSDVLDTALSLQVQKSGQILLSDMATLLETLKKRALETQSIATIGRSHGIYAEPTSFGLKFLSWYCELLRNRERLGFALENMRFGKLSGTVGVNPHWSPSVEERILQKLNLKREPVSTQVIPRDRHAEFLLALAICGSSLERISIELRHLQRSEVAEAIEGFDAGQKGSSAMPHKRNPISAENLTGIARLLRSYAQAGLENIALWHERDISHSSVERVVFPDATILLNYGLRRMEKLIRNLSIQEIKIKEHLEDAGQTVFSGHVLLALVENGASREESYYWVQECALKAIESKKPFMELVKAHEKIKAVLDETTLSKVGSIEFQLQNVSEIYSKVLQSSKKG